MNLVHPAALKRAAPSKIIHHIKLYFIYNPKMCSSFRVGIGTSIIMLISFPQGIMLLLSDRNYRLYLTFFAG